jgi:hypothetical protein
MVSPDGVQIAGRVACSYPHPRPRERASLASDPARGRGAIEPRDWMWGGQRQSEFTEGEDAVRHSVLLPSPLREGVGGGGQRGNADDPAKPSG